MLNTNFYSVNASPAVRHSVAPTPARGTGACAPPTFLRMARHGGGHCE